MTVALREYQKTAARDVLRLLRSGISTLLVAPTGSGKTIIAAEVAESFKRVLVIAHRREILEQARKVFGWHVCAQSVQGFSSKKASDLLPKHPDLLIIDEAHRSAAKTYRQIISRYPDTVRFGLTATPLRMDGKGLRDAFSELVVCSSVPELVESGHLVPYRALEAPDEALKELAWMKRLAGDYEPHALSDLMSRPRLVGDVVSEYQKHGEGRTAIAFAVSVQHSKLLVSAFRDKGIKACHLDGKASETNRKRTLALLSQGKIDVLCNVNLFTEGWDCPPVSCVIMARPTASLTLYLQSIGRGMRPAEGKADLLILDHAGNIERHGPPEMERAWSLESDRERVTREAEIAELERLHALGFESVEAELEEKRRICEHTYAISDPVFNIFPVADRDDLCEFLSRRGLHRIIKYARYGSRFRKSEVDAFVLEWTRFHSTTYSSEEAAILLGRPKETRYTLLLSYLSARGIKPAKHRTITGLRSERRYSRSEIDALVASENEHYSTPEAAEILGRPLKNFSTFLRTRGVLNQGGLSQASLYLKSDIDRLKAEMDSAVSRKEASIMLDMDPRRTGSYLKIRGIRPCRFDHYSRRDIETLLRDDAETYSTRVVFEILAKAGLGGRSPRYWLKQKGIEPVIKASSRTRYKKTDIDDLVRGIK